MIRFILRESLHNRYYQGYMEVDDFEQGLEKIFSVWDKEDLKEVKLIKLSKIDGLFYDRTCFSEVKESKDFLCWSK